MEASDAELLRAWASGDAAAGRALFGRHFASLRRFFRAKLPEQADDLTQSTMLRSLESAGRLEGGGSYRAYLFAIARNELFDELRRRRPGVTLDPDMTSCEELGPTPSRALVEQSERRVLLEALRRIPLDAQVLLELCYWEELSSPELGAVLGIPASTVRSRLSTARARLQERLAEITRGTPLHSTVDDLDGWAARIRSYAERDDDA